MSKDCLYVTVPASVLRDLIDAMEAYDDPAYEALIDAFDKAQAPVFTGVEKLARVVIEIVPDPAPDSDG